MKLKFDSTLSYQLEAIKSVTDLFEGQPERSSGFQIDFGRGGSMYNDLGIGNDLALSGELIVQNLHAIQSRNNVPKSRLLQEEGSAYDFPNFSVEMETGTGKTTMVTLLRHSRLKSLISLSTCRKNIPVLKMRSLGAFRSICRVIL